MTGKIILFFTSNIRTHHKQLKLQRKIAGMFCILLNKFSKIDFLNNDVVATYHVLYFFMESVVELWRRIINLDLKE